MLYLAKNSVFKKMTEFFKITAKKDERETTKEVEANIVIWFELQKYERLF